MSVWQSHEFSGLRTPWLILETTAFDEVVLNGDVHRQACCLLHDAIGRSDLADEHAFAHRILVVHEFDKPFGECAGFGVIGSVVFLLFAIEFLRVERVIAIPDRP